MSTAVLAQPPLARTLPQMNGVYGTTEPTVIQGMQTPEATVPRNLEDGAVVVMYSGPGELIIVRQNGKTWDLEPISTADDSEGKLLSAEPRVTAETWL